jgi:hypothetical protein
MKLPTFSGSGNENYERFFDEMDIMKEINGWNDATFLNIVKFHIKGGAATWLKSTAEDAQDSIEKVRGILKETFGDKRPAWLRHRDLNNLRQEKNEDVTAFALRVKTYMRPNMEDGEFISVFVSGLHRGLGQELAKADLKSFHDAVGMAVRLESVEKKHLDKKGDLMLLERTTESQQVEEHDGDPAFIGVVENYFIGTNTPATSYSPVPPTYQQAAAPYNSNPAARSYRPNQSSYGPPRGGNGAARGGRFAGQGYYNNRMQGPPAGRGSGLNMEEYRARAVNRAEAYRKTMDRLYGLTITEAASGTPDGGNDNGKYCIIHDARSHSTEECALLTDYHQNLGERHRQAHENKGTSRAPSGQGN